MKLPVHAFCKRNQRLGLLDPETGFHYLVNFAVVRETAEGEEVYFVDSYRGVAIWTDPAGDDQVPPAKAKLFTGRLRAEGIRWRLVRGWLVPRCAPEEVRVVEVLHRVD